LVMRVTQDDCPSISVSRLRALGEVTEGMGSVRVAIAGVEREVRLSHLRFPNGGGWSFFLCPVCGRRASSQIVREDRMLALHRLRVPPAAVVLSR
jgi:hypothetical protein